MKKIILGLIAWQSLALATDIEKGYTGIEFDTNTSIINTEKKIENPLFKKYSLMKINNEYLVKTLTDDNTDRENIYKLAYTFSKIDNSKGNGFNLLYSYSPELEKRIGFNLNYTDLDSKNSKGDFSQLNIFYSYKDYSDFTHFFTTLYSGYSKEKSKTSSKLNSKFIGLYTKYSDVIDNYYDNFYPKFYIENDIKRIEEKPKTSKNKKRKNSSINFGIGTELEKVIYEEALKISIIPIISYNHEFLSKKKYKDSKDPFEQEARIGVELKAEYNEVSKLFIRYDYKKSFNTSNNMNVFTAGIKIML
ncbi:hypothetical protein SAMN02745174_02424 [Cetobacterium ceti]|uniref:Uncharacterized protein n=1 Tax=Cetobacterium ceti TaxID=180163 RepID=A0A1T4QRK4_9FUSO|nr:hypothetical protein [Cetobacterium ceti]SKA06360.1 hypothetical protein SAMN02745174_02424 [Cetobacterium ceti]